MCATAAKVATQLKASFNLIWVMNVKNHPCLYSSLYFVFHFGLILVLTDVWGRRKLILQTSPGLGVFLRTKCALGKYGVIAWEITL